MDDVKLMQALNSSKGVSRELVAETDWLASTPVFYDLKRSLVSSKIQEVTPRIETVNLHPEGLFNFLDFGYSVFGQTPIEEVRFLRHTSQIWRNHTGELKVEELADPIDKYTDWRISESDVIELIRDRVQRWEASLPADQEIVLPLSGGFDSRLLLWCLGDPTRVRAYTYGLSEDQSRSTEVVHAKALARKFGVRWEHIPLGDFHDYFDDWDAEFGVSTHAHGMYHFEFYSKIRQQLNGRQAFLSGIIGDAWAGSISPRKIDSPNDLTQLGHTHGMRADPSQLLMSFQHNLREHFWSEQRYRLEDYRTQVVTTIRLKMILISYLMRVPRLFNFEPWSPYLDIDIAMAMLNLPEKRLANRQWQRDFFVKAGLDLENQGLKSLKSNSLNLQGLRKRPLPPIKKDALSAIIDPLYLDWVNKNMKPDFVENSLNLACSIPKIGGALRRLNLHPKTLEAYCAYLSIKPIEKLILD